MCLSKDTCPGACSHQFSPDLVPDTRETPMLKRQTLVPELDFVVLPLEQHTVQPILKLELRGWGRWKSTRS